MKIQGELINGALQIQRASERLLESWQHCRDVWRDRNAERFEEERLRPMLDQIQLVLDAAARMNDVLQQAHRECDDAATRLQD